MSSVLSWFRQYVDGVDAGGIELSDGIGYMTLVLQGAQVGQCVFLVTDKLPADFFRRQWPQAAEQHHMMFAQALDVLQQMAAVFMVQDATISPLVHAVSAFAATD